MKQNKKINKENLIPVDQFCAQHEIEFSFISTLNEFGLIEMSASSKNYFVGENQLRELEKMVRLHRDLNINSKGIDAITHLLTLINDMQIEITSLKNKLRRYENSEQ